MYGNPFVWKIACLFFTWRGDAPLFVIDCSALTYVFRNGDLTSKPSPMNPKIGGFCHTFPITSGLISPAHRRLSLIYAPGLVDADANTSLSYEAPRIEFDNLLTHPAGSMLAGIPIKRT